MTLRTRLFALVSAVVATTVILTTWTVSSGARTLSTEWARHGIVITCVHVRARSDALVAFLCSPAGDYYSGCAFTLAGG